VVESLYYAFYRALTGRTIFCAVRMEARAHSRDTYAEAGQISWMEQDLLECSSDFKSSFKEKPAYRSYPLPSRGKNEKPRVCIVGAGLAGLRCAEVLIQGGIEVTILEARDRLGGRVSLQCLINVHIINNGYSSIKWTLQAIPSTCKHIKFL
jgi:NADPH-dependent 2,4-dienoyl-CoA reductase/sulfur reductase-like enzyme